MTGGLAVVSLAAALTTSTAAQAPGAPSFQVEAVAAGQELGQLRAALATVERLMSQPTLWSKFDAIAAQYSQIFVGPDFSANGMADPGQAKALLRGANAGYRVFPAQIGLTGTYYAAGDDYTGTCRNPAGQPLGCRTTAFDQNYTNMKAVTHGLGRNANGRELVSIEIGRELFDRYNAPSAVRRSCTYNTIAHEWTHTIGKDQASHWAIAIDTGSGLPSTVPKLPYLFGSVVQCTWLQGEGEIGASAADLKACVNRFGVADFKSLQCV